MIIVPDAYSMLQVLVHDDYISNAELHLTGVSTWWLYHLHFACYGIGTIIFLIVTVNREYPIIVLIARDFVFQTFIVSAWIWFLLVSAELFAVWVSIHVNVSLEVVCFTICCPLQLSDCSSIFALYPHNLSIWLCFYTCQTHTLLLNNVLYHTQSFSVF